MFLVFFSFVSGCVCCIIHVYYFLLKTADRTCQTYRGPAYPNTETLHNPTTKPPSHTPTYAHQHTHTNRNPSDTPHPTPQPTQATHHTPHETVHPTHPTPHITGRLMMCPETIRNHVKPRVDATGDTLPGFLCERQRRTEANHCGSGTSRMSRKTNPTSRMATRMTRTGRTRRI